MENKLTYTKVGDYYIPNLTINPSPPIGKYGRMRRDYLRDHRPALYNRLVLREQLQEHCAEVNEAIENRIFYVPIASGHNKTSYGSFFNSTIGGSFFHCPFLLDLFVETHSSFN